MRIKQLYANGVLVARNSHEIREIIQNPTQKICVKIMKSKSLTANKSFI